MRAVIDRKQRFVAALFAFIKLLDKKSKSYGNGVLNVLGKGQNKASGIANRQTEYAGCPQGSS